jgi:hypothetical protein
MRVGGLKPDKLLDLGLEFGGGHPLPDHFPFELGKRQKDVEGQPSQPLSVATPRNFRIEKIVPSFPPVGRSVRRLEQKKVLICSTLSLIPEASLQSAFSNFPISPAS